MNVLLLKMGGIGTRFGEKIPKQYQTVDGIPVFCHVLKEYEKSGIIDKYALVVTKDRMEYAEAYARKIVGDKLLGVTEGGDTGAKSIRNGVLFVSGYMKPCDILLMHDASNVIVVKEKIGDVINAAKEFGFSTLGSEQVHALYSQDENGFVTGTVDKKTVCSGYSPEAFIFRYVYDCYSAATDEELQNSVSAISLAERHNAKVKIVPASFVNLKLTYKSDLENFEKLNKEL